MRIFKDIDGMFYVITVQLFMVFMGGMYKFVDNGQYAQIISNIWCASSLICSCILVAFATLFNPNRRNR